MQASLIIQILKKTQLIHCYQSNHHPPLQASRSFTSRSFFCLFLFSCRKQCHKLDSARKNGFGDPVLTTPNSAPYSAGTRLFLAPRPLEKSEINTKNSWLEIEKEIVREVARGDKPYLRKFTDCKAQISPLNWTNAFLICALRSVDFLR